MKVFNIDSNTTDISLTSKELLIIANSLNEVCHGMHVHEFESRVGATKEEVSELLRLIGYIMKALEQQLLDEQKINNITLIDDKWLLCPICLDAWESNSQDPVISCQKCKRFFPNPRQKGTRITNE